MQATGSLPEEKKNHVTMMSQYAPYSQPMREHVNPLLFNKGSVRGDSDHLKFARPTQIASTKSKSGPLPEDERTLFLQRREAEDGDEMKRSGTLSSICSEGFSNTSELNSDERKTQLFQLPLFEIHGTIQQLIKARRLLPQEEQAENQNDSPADSLSPPSRPPGKSRTMQPDKGVALEKLAEDLTPQQYEYFKEMYAFKGSYLLHVLHVREIYFQYVSISKNDMSYTTSHEFTTQVSRLLTQKPRFARRPDQSAPGTREKTKGAVGKKTLVLDLDETLVYASSDMIFGHDMSFIFSDIISESEVRPDVYKVDIRETATLPVRVPGRYEQNLRDRRVHCC